MSAASISATRTVRVWWNRFGPMFAVDISDLTPETWPRLNVSLGLFEGGQDATKTTYPGTDHKQAA